MNNRLDCIVEGNLYIAPTSINNVTETARVGSQLKTKEPVRTKSISERSWPYANDERFTRKEGDRRSNHTQQHTCNAYNDTGSGSVHIVDISYGTYSFNVSRDALYEIHSD